MGYSEVRVRTVIWRAGILVGLAVLSCASSAYAQNPQDQPPPVDRLRDRGEGVSTSMFGTYIRRGELLVYPFFEYYRDHNYEYEAGELGFVGATEHRGRYRAHEGLIFLAYGISDNVAVEFEAATISASLEKSTQDGSGLPSRLEQSGVGDVEGQIRWRWRRETESRSELFSYFETVAPVQRKKLLIGTPGWEYKFGTGMIRGRSWGTITIRGAVAYADGSPELGEVAFEYLRRLSNRLRFYAGVEATQDEVELIAEAQVFISRNIVLKLNSGLGVTSKATDWAPEIGVMFSFPLSARR